MELVKFRLLFSQFKIDVALAGLAQWIGPANQKGRWLDSQSGHTPGLRARSPVEGAHEATAH